MLRPTIANEPDRDRRRELERQRRELTEEHLTPIALERIEAAHEARARRSVRRPTLELYRDRFGFELDGLADAVPRARSRRPSASTRSCSTAACARKSASGSTRPSTTT